MGIYVYVYVLCGRETRDEEVQDEEGVRQLSLTDLHGEEDPGLMRGRPLSLSRHRLQSLEQLLWTARVGKEVGSRQVTAESVIRDSYY